MGDILTLVAVRQIRRLVLCLFQAVVGETVSARAYTTSFRMRVARDSGVPSGRTMALAHLHSTQRSFTTCAVITNCSTVK